MDTRFRYDNIKLYIDRRMQANRNQRKSIKKSSKVWREGPRIKKGTSKGVYKGKREKQGNGQEGKRARKRKKGLEEVRNGGTQIEAREEQEKMTADQIIEERGKREAEERGKKIREFKYNIHCRNIAKEKWSKYLEGRMKWKNYIFSLQQIIKCFPLFSIFVR